jgi:hypothetical protein
MCEKCGDRFTVFADLARNNVIDVPKKCDGNAASQKCRGKVVKQIVFFDFLGLICLYKKKSDKNLPNN